MFTWPFTVKYNLEIFKPLTKIKLAECQMKKNYNPTTKIEININMVNCNLILCSEVT